MSAGAIPVAVASVSAGTTVTGRGARRSRQIPRPPAFGLTAAVLVALVAVWVAWFPHSPDLAAQVYREHLFAVSGFSLWDNNWYAGHYLLDYSVLFAPVAAVLGLRWVGAIAVACSTACFVRLTGSRLGSRAPLAGALFATGAAGDLFIGRVTYAVGVALAMAAVLAAVRGRAGVAAVLSFACGAASPIAALFLALAAASDLLVHRTWRRPLATAGPGLVVVVGVAIVFPAGGYESFSLGSLLPAVLAAVAVIVVLRRDRLVRCGAGLYLGALLLAYVVRSPMGSNVVRLGVLLAPALLAGAARPPSNHRRARVLCLLAIMGATAWQLNGPAVQSVEAAEDPSTHLSYYLPVIRYLDQQRAAGPMRIEVAFTRDHWDAVALGGRFALARGWERQLDTQYNSVFYAPNLTAGAYRAWLLNDAVRFVVLSDAALDPSSRQEAGLIRRGLPYLKQVFHSAHWSVFAVLGARPLASGPGRLVTLDDDGFALDAQRPGRFLVRIHYTPFWQVTRGRATVTPAPGGWTTVTAPVAGPLTVDANL